MPEPISPNAEQLRPEPRLVWEGPDDDGDFIVWLEGIPNWHLCHHGKTREAALAGLGEGMMIAHKFDEEKANQ